MCNFFFPNIVTEHISSTRRHFAYMPILGIKNYRNKSKNVIELVIVILVNWYISFGVLRRIMIFNLLGLQWWVVEMSFFLRGKKMSFSAWIVPEGKTSDGDILFLVVREACASLHNGASDWGPPENPWTSRIIWCRMAERVFQLGPI